MSDQLEFPGGEERDAVLSPCGLYRYSLRRQWAPGHLVAFVGLNPSTADANIDDRTICKCRGFARRWGYSGFVMVNLFAFRATNPRVMKKAADPVGPENDAYLKHWSATTTCGLVAMWGAHGRFMERDTTVIKLLQGRIDCLRHNQDGTPCHLLYLPYSSRLRPFEVVS